MNIVLTQGAATATLGEISGISTFLFLVCFVGWVVYLWSPSRKLELEQAAQLPLDRED
jgi:cbb3-type cytochrome oxidase subunit 3